MQLLAEAHGLFRRLAVALLRFLLAELVELDSGLRLGRRGRGGGYPDGSLLLDLGFVEVEGFFEAAGVFLDPPLEFGLTVAFVGEAVPVIGVLNVPGFGDVDHGAVPGGDYGRGSRVIGVIGYRYLAFSRGPRGELGAVVAALLPLYHDVDDGLMGHALHAGEADIVQGGTVEHRASLGPETLGKEVQGDNGPAFLEVFLGSIMLVDGRKDVGDKGLGGHELAALALGVEKGLDFLVLPGVRNALAVTG